MKFAVTMMVLMTTAAALADEIVAPGAKLEKIATGFGLADGPSYDGKGNLYFPDVKAGHIFRYSEADGKATIFKENFGKVSSTFFSVDGKLTAVDNGKSRIVQFDGDQVKVLAQEEETKPPRAPNDMTLDSQGGVYYTLSRQACVQYAHDGKITTVVPVIKGANGIAISPDEKTLYVAAHSERTLWAYPVEAPGKIGPGKPLATLGPGPGAGADGLKVDAAGNLYCAGQGGIWVTSPTGAHLATIPVEEKPLVNLCFGGKDYKTLYIVAGTSLYRIQLTVPGLAMVRR